MEEGNEATPCPVCGESIDDRLIAYLTSRLTSGLRRAAGVSAKIACTNQCTRPTVDLMEAFPKQFGDK